MSKDPNDAVPAKLKEVVTTGYTVWYQVDINLLAEQMHEAIRKDNLVLDKRRAFAGLEERYKEEYRREAVAVLNFLSNHVSARFTEMELYCVAMYRVLMALRGMAGDAGTITDGETTVDIEKALGWERPAPFAGLNNRVEAIFIAARGLRQIRQADAGGRPGGPAATSKVPRRVEDEQERGEAIDALLDMIAALDNTLSAGTPAYEAGAGQPAGGAGGSTPEPTPQTPPAATPAPKFDPPKLIPSDSSMISAYAYDEEKQLFYIQWKKPGKNPPFGVYSNVTREKFREFTSAPSKGSHMLDEFVKRPDLYPYRYLDALPF
jgi:hypothetical protein